MAALISLAALSFAPGAHPPRASSPTRPLPPPLLSLPSPSPSTSPPSEQIVPVVLHEEMSESYMAYAMSVIMSRALPDARDGLKPVHRRILYAMHALNLAPDTPHRKCARVVGEVLGKFHPHGDSSVYGALVRMAQPFSLRAPLIDGHGNFGSIDPDPAAAMRYTECRLAPLARDALLADVGEGVVDFVDNFDVSEKEPEVLPARLPMLLLNGATGIAVGMATNCPPHNLGELVDVLQAFLRDPEMTDEEMFELLPAPDFPGGGTIMGLKGVKEMYTTGRGSIVLRAKAHVEMLQTGRVRDREAIVVSELPFGVAKNVLLERIAALVNEKKVEGVAEIRDESSMEGLRVIFEVKRDADPLVVLNNLYKRSALQQSFSANLMAVLGSGRMPELLTLRRALSHFVEFRVECLRRRCSSRLRKAESRLHIVRGLIQALGQMDGVIETIRAAETVADARTKLMAKPFELSEAQGDALLAMQLRRLTALEAQALEKEAKTLGEEVSELQALLADRSLVEELIRKELGELKTKHATPRRTMIGTAAEAELNEIDLTPEEQCIIIRSSRGYVKRLLLDQFDAQNRGTRGKGGMTNLGETDAVVQVLTCSSHATMLCISQRGVAYALPAYKVPASSRSARGLTFQQLLPISDDETIETVLPVTTFSEDVFLTLLTRNGWIKRTPLDAFQKISSRGLIAISLSEDDVVVRASLCGTGDSVMLSSRRGQAIRFATTPQQLRASGRSSRGVKSMQMREDDVIVDMAVVRRTPLEDAGTPIEEDQKRMLVAVTKSGFGKRIDVDLFREVRRGGKGIITIKFKKPEDELVALSQAFEDDQLLLITTKGTILRQSVGDISQQGRAATGVQLQRLDPDDHVASVSIVPSGAYGEADMDEPDEAGAGVD